MGKAERTRQFIIETAAPIFNEKGVSGTSVDDVLKATKVAKGCLYGHFANKEELSFAVVDHLLEKTATNSITAMNQHSTATKKLLALLDVYKNPLTGILEGGCPILNFAVDADDTSPVIRQKVNSLIEKTLEIISEIIRKGVEDKEFSKEIDADGFALKIFALIEGSIMICRVTNSIKPMTDVRSMLKKEIEMYQLK